MASSSFGRRPAGLRLERIKSSPRFQDGAFRNSAPVGSGLKRGSTLSTMGEYVWGGQRRVPLAPLPSENPLATWALPLETGLRATWLGHSTVLVELDGARILTATGGETNGPLIRCPGPGETCPPLALGSPRPAATADPLR